MKVIYLFLIIICLCMTISASDIPLNRAPLENRIDSRLEKIVSNSKPDNLIKVWVYFTDKGIDSEDQLKVSLDQLYDKFSQKSISRRLIRKQGNGAGPFDYYDLPVHQAYAEQLSASGMQVRYLSRWFNAAAGYVTVDQMDNIKELSFVYKIRPVETYKKRSIETIESNIPPSYKTQGNVLLPEDFVATYGGSFNQLNMVNIPTLHYNGYTGDSIVIALFDTGFDLDYPSLSHINVLESRDYIIDELIDLGISDTLTSQSSHGTRVLSLIAAYAEENLIGAAYDAKFLLAKTEITGPSNEIKAEELNWVAAAEWVDSAGADIISSSLGYLDWYTYDDLDGQTADITIAAEIAASRGIVIVNSAGNERNNSWHFIIPPADGPNVIAVGAVDFIENLTGYSSAGPTADGRIKPDVLAQGSGVWTINYKTDSYINANQGTSFSAPITAGAAALILQANPDWTPTEVIAALRQSGNRANNPDSLYGYGVFDLLEIVDVPNNLISRLEVPFGPNPFTDSVLIYLSWMTGNVKKMSIFNAAGEKVWEETADIINDGPVIVWHGVNASGEEVAAGVYFIYLQTEKLEKKIKLFKRE